MVTCDFLVVGAGIAGASIGYELASHGKTVVLERESLPGYHTTGRSAALYSLAYTGTVVKELGLASFEFFSAPPAGFTEVKLVSPQPYLLPAREDQKKIYDESIEEAREFGYEIVELNTKQCLERCPVLREETAWKGILEPGAHSLDVNALHQGYLSGLKKRGGLVFVNSEVTAMSFGGGRWSVKAGSETFDCRVIVNAAGAWGDIVAQYAGAKPLGLRPCRRTIFTFAAPQGTKPHSWPFVYDIEEKFYFKLENGMILASPADEIESPPCDATPTDYEIALGAERIQEATTLEIKHIMNRWAGLRTFAPDRKPVIGFDAKVPNFFWAVGQGGFGIMTSPAISQISAALISQKKLPDSIKKLGLKEEVFSPSRFKA